MRLHEIKSTHTHKKARRVGRGNAAGGGTTAGRGTKGQKARTGANSNVPRTFIGGSTSLIQRLPKLKGFKSRAVKPIALNLTIVEKHFEDGDNVTLLALLEKGVVSAREAEMGVKILGGTKKPTKKLTFEEGNPQLTRSKRQVA
jgi:large subunit ribosomal protein L15